MPRQQNDLSHVKPVMRDLAVDSLHDRVGFAADGNREYQVRFRKWLQSLKKAFPPVLPGLQQSLAAWGWVEEFAITVTVRLFPVRGQEISPAGPHVA